MGSELIDRLGEEWDWLSRSRKGATALRRWAERDVELRGSLTWGSLSSSCIAGTARTPRTGCCTGWCAVGSPTTSPQGRCSPA